MEKSKTPLRKWFMAMQLLARGANARQLSDVLRVTYKTAWLIGHKIRHAILLAESELSLTGGVKVLESRFGPTSFASMFDRNAKCHPLIAAAAVSEDGERLLRVKWHQVAPIHLLSGMITKEGFQQFIKDNVSPNAKISLARGLYQAVRHPLSRFCRTAVRWMNKTYLGLGPKHLQAYLDEYAYRQHFSSGDNLDVQDLLQRCASRPVITYPQLVRQGHLPHPHLVSKAV